MPTTVFMSTSTSGLYGAARVSERVAKHSCFERSSRECWNGKWFWSKLVSLGTWIASGKVIEMPSVVGDVVRSVGLSTAMRAAGVITGLLPIPQPTLLVGPGASRRLGEALCGFGHRKILIVTDRIVAQKGLPKALCRALADGGIAHVVFDAVTPDAPI